MNNRIGIIGYGEVGKTFATGLKIKPGIESVSVWDLKFADALLQKKELAHAQGAGVAACPSMQALCAQADWLISAVTASNTLAVAQEAAKFIKPGTLFLDLNSASPGTKQQASKAIEAAGGQYVEAGVMTSIPPYGIRVPMLLGGPQADALATRLRGYAATAWMRRQCPRNLAWPAPSKCAAA